MVAVGTIQDPPIMAAPNEYSGFFTASALQATPAQKNITGQQSRHGSQALTLRHTARLFVEQSLYLEFLHPLGAHVYSTS